MNGGRVRQNVLKVVAASAAAVQEVYEEAAAAVE